MSDEPQSFLKLLRRYPYGAVCVVLALALGATAWFLSGWIEELKVTHQEKVREGEAMLALLVGGSVQRQELAAAREITHRIEENLVVESNLAENTWYFFKLEEQTKARLPELHQLSSPITDKSPLFKRIPYTLRVVGTHEQVASFMRALETGPRLVNITSFSLGKVDPSGAQLSLDLTLELLGKK
ncbi:MAG: type 4a pilus biogenesis protein PilO [Opitutaceae bacterium]|nr:type 4a pilus biogenesis protein PilO [Opitutaceae bacterium]